MKTIIFIFILFLFYFSSNFSLLANRLSIDVDAATFRINNEISLWEMYYSLPDSCLKYEFDGKNFKAEMFFSVTISSSIKIIDEKEWIVENSRDSIAKNTYNDLLGQKNFYLPSGQYKVSILAKDMHDTLSQVKKEFNILLREFSKERISISDIEFIRIIEPENKKSKNWSENFKKNKLYVVPNPSLEFIGTQPEISCYFEIYNSKSFSPVGFDINYRIFDNTNRELLLIPQHRKSEADGLVETISIPAEALASGSYYLQVTINSQKEDIKDSVITQKKFFVLNPLMPPTTTPQFLENMTFEQSEFAAMSTQDVDKEFSLIKNIAQTDQIELYEQLTTLEAKRKFLYSYWIKLDTDTTTYINEAREEFRKLVDYASSHFRYGKMLQGWKTDRGRILIKYGMPTKIDTYPIDGEHRQYEIWFYDNIQGGVSFDFVDHLGLGNYLLVNSTARGERRNDNWYNEWVVPQNPDAMQNYDTNRK